jgi:hypothetical protein
LSGNYNYKYYFYNNGAANNYNKYFNYNDYNTATNNYNEYFNID